MIPMNRSYLFSKNVEHAGSSKPAFSQQVSNPINSHTKMRATFVKV